MSAGYHAEEKGLVGSRKVQHLSAGASRPTGHPGPLVNASQADGRPPAAKLHHRKSEGLRDGLWDLWPHRDLSGTEGRERFVLPTSRGEEGTQRPLKVTRCWKQTSLHTSPGGDFARTQWGQSLPRRDRDLLRNTGEGSLGGLVDVLRHF